MPQSIFVSLVLENVERVQGHALLALVLQCALGKDILDGCDLARVKVFVEGLELIEVIDFLMVFVLLRFGEGLSRQTHLRERFVFREVLKFLGNPLDYLSLLFKRDLVEEFLGLQVDVLQRFN